MQPRAVALRFMLLLALAAVPAGCGSEAPVPEADLTTEQVMEHFAGRTGTSLVVTSAYQDPSWDILGFPEDVPPTLKRRYGTFSVYVVKQAGGTALSSLLADKTTGEPLQARRGIFWELDTLSGTWVAHTRYGPNVVLVWFSEKEKPEVDARWQRLHRVLARMTS